MAFIFLLRLKQAVYDKRASELITHWQEKNDGKNWQEVKSGGECRVSFGRTIYKTIIVYLLL